MSRKARIADSEKAQWNSVKFYQLNKGYAIPKPLPTLPPGSVVILNQISKESLHPFVWMSPLFHPILFPQYEDGTEPPVICLLDFSELCNDGDEMNKMLDLEGGRKDFDKSGVGKPVARALEKLHLKNATLVGVGNTCQLLLKMMLVKDHNINKESVSKVILIHPTISITCVNSLFVGHVKSSSNMYPILECLFETEISMNKRSPVLRGVFKLGKDEVNTMNTIKKEEDEGGAAAAGTCSEQIEFHPDGLLFSLDQYQILFSYIAYMINKNKSYYLNNAENTENSIENFVQSSGNINYKMILKCFNDEYCYDELGKSLFFSELIIEMSKYTKQYEQSIDDISDDIKNEFLNHEKHIKKQMIREQKGNQQQNDDDEDDEEDDDEDDEEEDGDEIGAIVLRGSRCVLVRFPEGATHEEIKKWPGVRIPSIKQIKPTPEQIAAATTTKVKSSGGAGGAGGGLDYDVDDFATAIRAVSTLCEIDGINELKPLRNIPPVALYRPYKNKSSRKNQNNNEKDNDNDENNQNDKNMKKILVYFLYAVMPPPPGPLEEADVEDDEDVYDWYTFPRAIEALRYGSADDYLSADIVDQAGTGNGDGSSSASETPQIDGLKLIEKQSIIKGVWKKRNESAILTMHTIAFALHGAASFNQLPIKWGGVFGQELIHSLAHPTNANPNQSQSHSSSTNQLAEQQQNATSSLSSSSSTSNSSSFSLSSSIPSDTLRSLPVPFSEVSEGNEDEIAYAKKQKEKDPLRSLKELHNLNQSEQGVITDHAQNDKITSKETKKNENDENEGEDDNDDDKISPIPVTILSGFLGAGKTTLLKHILTNTMGLKVAVIVNDMADINVDANIIKDHSGRLVQSQEKMIELTNGCICCTLREDLYESISSLATSNMLAKKKNKNKTKKDKNDHNKNNNDDDDDDDENDDDERIIDYILIESSGISEPLPVAETFTFKDESSGMSLMTIAKLDTLVTVIDGSTFINELMSIDVLKTRGWETTKDDERTIAQLFMDQIEFANVIIINKIDLLSQKEINKIKLFLYEMNKTAIIYESINSIINPNKILNTNLFNLMNAAEHSDWLKEARIGEHVPESLEYGISSFTFRSAKPFNPMKLYEIIKIIESRKSLSPLSSSSSSSNNKNEDDDTTSTSASASTSSAMHVIRAKGIIWLASELGFKMQGIASYAGNCFNISPGNAWWITINKSEWPLNLDKAIEPLWKDVFGDRQNEIVIIGQYMNHKEVESLFNSCLISDEEFDSLKSLSKNSNHLNSNSNSNLNPLNLNSDLDSRELNLKLNSFENPFESDWLKTLQLAELQASDAALASRDHNHNHDHSH